MMINNINNIGFKNNTTEVTPIGAGSADAILMLSDPKASVRFQRNKEFVKKADSVDSNPVVALGYKLYRTFGFMNNNKTEEPDDVNSTKLDLIA